MLHWLVSRPPSLIVFSPSSMLQLGRSQVFVARLVSRTLLPVSTGYAHPSEFSSSWRSLSTELFTALLLNICPIYCVALLTLPSRRRLRSSLTGRLDVRPSDLPRHCRRPLIFYCRPHAVQQFAKRHHICLVAASVLS